MWTVLLPPGVNPIEVKYIYMYHISSMDKVVSHMIYYSLLLSDVLLSVCLCKGVCVQASWLLYLSLYFE
jgi:hypothetical protein